MADQIRLVESAEFKTLEDTEDIGLIKYSASDVKAAKGERALEFIISDGETDRDKDQISVKGWDLKSYRKNPVVLFGHNSYEPPIARATKVWTEGGQLLAIAEFTPLDLNPFGDMIYRMFEEKFMRAVSVGFRPTEFKWVEDDEDRKNGIDFTKQELLEFSAVPVPANPRALMRAHEVGIDTGPLRDWAIQILDLNPDNVKGLARNELEDAWKLVTSRPIIIDLGAGHQPETSDLDADDPPKGGSGVPTPKPDQTTTGGLSVCECGKIVTSDYEGANCPACGVEWVLRESKLDEQGDPTPEPDDEGSFTSRIRDLVRETVTEANAELLEAIDKLAAGIKDALWDNAAQGKKDDELDDVDEPETRDGEIDDVEPSDPDDEVDPEVIRQITQEFKDRLKDRDK